MSSFKLLALSELRADLPKFKRQVQLGMKRIAATYYGDIVGFLVPIKDVSGFEDSGLIEKSEEMSLSDFRSQLTECWERLQIDIDCIYVTYHTRRAIAFVSTRLICHLPIPISEVTSKLLSVNSGIIDFESTESHKEVESNV
jgi:hypothetical protein